MWRLDKNIWQESEFPFYNLVTTRSCGNLRDPEVREQFCGSSGINYQKVVTAQQVHGSVVAVVDEKDAGTSIPDADGLITHIKSLPIAIFTADCMAVFFAHKKAGVAGVVHAGWRGLAKGIIKEAVNLIVKDFNVEAKDIKAAIGPHIQKCCYSVGDELREVFGMEKGDAKLDLSAIAQVQLRELGVSGVSLNRGCTCHESDIFHSYRRDKTEGRMMSLIYIT